MIPSKLLIRYMAHILHRCSFAPFSMESKELQPFEHCVLLKQAFNAVGPRGYKLAISQDRETTTFKSSEDYDSVAIARRSAERVVDSFRGYFCKLPPLPKPKDKTKVAFQATDSFAEYLNTPLLDISRMHKEDNIQVVVSTPRPSLVLEEKEARDQLKRQSTSMRCFSKLPSSSPTYEKVPPPKIREASSSP